MRPLTHLNTPGAHPRPPQAAGASAREKIEINAQKLKNTLARAYRSRTWPVEHSTGFWLEQAGRTARIQPACSGTWIAPIRARAKRFLLGTVGAGWMLCQLGESLRRLDLKARWAHMEMEKGRNRRNSGPMLCGPGRRRVDLVTRSSVAYRYNQI
jgi:hypothetical protein